MNVINDHETGLKVELNIFLGVDVFFLFDPVRSLHLFQFLVHFVFICVFEFVFVFVSLYICVSWHMQSFPIRHNKSATKWIYHFLSLFHSIFCLTSSFFPLHYLAGFILFPAPFSFSFALFLFSFWFICISWHKFYDVNRILRLFTESKSCVKFYRH